MDRRPALGLVLPVEIADETYRDGITDGDTVRMRRSGSNLQFPVRIIDCWAPEITIRGKARYYSPSKKKLIKKSGELSRRALIQLFSFQDDIRLHIPFDGVEHDIMSLITLGRILGHIWIGDINIAAWMCSRKSSLNFYYAYRTKKELIQTGLA